MIPQGRRPLMRDRVQENLQDDPNLGLFTVVLYANTGIGDGNYVAWDMLGVSQNNVNAWFAQYRVPQTIMRDVSQPWFGEGNIHGDRVNSIHVPFPYWRLATTYGSLDYISWTSQSTNDSRVYYGIIINITPINANSCRIDYAIDWTASFWDTIQLGKCDITQETNPTSQEPYTNNIPEPWTPVPATRKQVNFDILGVEFSLNDITRCLTLSTTLCLQSQFGLADDGNGGYQIDYEKTKISFQLGAAVGGYTYCFPEGAYDTGNSDEPTQSGLMTAEQFMHTAISAGRGLWKSGQPIMSAITGAYFCPCWVAACTTFFFGQNTIMPAIDFTASSGILNPEQYAKYQALSTAINGVLPKLLSINNPRKPLYIPSTFGHFKTLTLDDLSKYCGVPIVNSKTLNLVSYSLISSTGEASFSPFQLDDWSEMPLVIYATGGAEGGLSIGIKISGIEDQLNNLPMVSTPNWPAAGIAGSLSTQYGTTRLGATFGFGKLNNWNPPY